jgi:tRNA(fMet)-specific endonuclease VapC
VVTARFLLDTNALAESTRDAPNHRFIRRFDQHRRSLAVAAPVWHEAVYGVRRMPPGVRQERVHTFLFEVLRPTVEILPYDEEAARWHAEERARLAEIGHPVGFADGMIAAVGARFDLPIVTHNVRDFERFSGITVVDWME